MSTIGSAAASEVEACARVVAEALRDDAVMRGMLPGEHDRVDRLTALHVAIFRAGPLRMGVIDVVRDPAGAIVAVGAWEGPQPRGVAAALRRTTASLRLARAYLALVGVRGLSAQLDDLRAYDECRPAGPHWYLADVAVSEAARGLGLGSALLEHRLRAVDAAGLPAYLEATTEGSRRLYERFGFVARGEVPVRGVRPVAMLRPAA